MKIRAGYLLAAAGLATLGITGSAEAQLRDLTQITDPDATTRINRSFTDQAGVGRGDTATPNSSMFIIKRDPFRAVRRGRQLFQRKFQVGQGFGPLTNDGVGNIAADASVGAGLVDSCAGCHGRPRGSAGHGGDVVTRPDSRDAPHLFGLGLQEQLGDEVTHDLRAIRAQAAALAAARNRDTSLALNSKGINYGTITVRANGTVDTSRVRGVNTDLRVRPFFAQGGTISMREFLVGAFNAEMGLESADSDLLTASTGGNITTPAGMVLNGATDQIEGPPANSTSADPDADGKVNEIPQSIVDFMEFYLLNYFKAGTGEETMDSLLGRTVFNEIGCNSCHISNLTIDSDRRVGDVETVFDSSRGIFNRLFATAAGIFVESQDAAGTAGGFPTFWLPAGGSFLVRNFFADLKRHDVGAGFYERNYVGSASETRTFQKQFITEPLWGVATTAPYGHDGRSINLDEVILRHGGEAQSQSDAFLALDDISKGWVRSFLSTLILFPPDDTASNLNPGNVALPEFPQSVASHGSINLGALFKTPGGE